jgi:hypothetical protein
MPLFNQETLNILKRLGFLYLVVNQVEAIGYARKEPTAKNTLDFLGLEEFEIATMKPEDIAALEEDDITIGKW